MTKQRYILRVEDGELFPWHEPWLRVPGMVEYDPDVHGFRTEVATALNLVEPKPTVAPAKVAVSERVAGQAFSPPTAATEPAVKVVQEPPTEPDLSDVFSEK